MRTLSGTAQRPPPGPKNARYTPASTTQLIAGGCSASSAASAVACSAAAEMGPVLAAASAERAAALCSWLGEKTWWLGADRLQLRL